MLDEAHSNEVPLPGRALVILSNASGNSGTRTSQKRPMRGGRSRPPPGQPPPQSGYARAKTAAARFVAPLIGVKAPGLLSDMAVRKAVGHCLRHPRSPVIWLFYSIAMAILTACLFTILLIILALGWAHIASVDIHRADRIAAVNAQLGAVTAPAIVYADYKFVGVAPTALLGPGHPDRQLAAPLNQSDVPEAYSKTIQALEQRTLASYRTNVFGIDWASTAMAAAMWFRRGGASGIAQQTARIEFGLRHEHESFAQTAGRKWTEAADGAALVADLKARNGSRWTDGLIKDYATIQPVAALPEISGLFAGAEKLFGVEPARLSDAQAAILAAAARRPLRFHNAGDGISRLAPNDERNLRSRAAYGLELAFAKDTTRRNKALADLARLPPLNRDGHSSPSAPSTNLLGNLPAKPTNIADSGAPLALHDLAAAHVAPESLSRIVLTTTGARQEQFRAGVIRAMDGIDADGHLPIELDSSRSMASAKRPPGDVIAFEANAKGDIDRLYSTTDFQPLDRRIELASAGKIVAAISLPGRCDISAKSVAWIFAKSEPAPLERLLRRCVSGTSLANILARFGFTAESSDLRHAIPFGQVVGTPRQLVAAYAALMDRIRGGDGTATAPHIVAMALGRNGSQVTLPVTSYRLDSKLAGSDNIAFAEYALYAPALPGGTVGGLAQMCPSIRLAKTGTQGGNGNDGNRERILAGAMADGHAFVVLVQARDGGLIGNVGRKDLLRLVQPFCQEG